MKVIISPEESLVIQMALTSFIQDVIEGLEMGAFNKTAKIELKKMLAIAVSTKEKMVAISGHEIKIEPLTPEEEKMFLNTQK